MRNAVSIHGYHSKNNNFVISDCRYFFNQVLNQVQVQVSVAAGGEEQSDWMQVVDDLQVSAVLEEELEPSDPVDFEY
jgi:hypothetical protein